MGVYLPRGVAEGKPESVPTQAGEQGVIAGPVKGIGSNPTSSMLGPASESSVALSSNANICARGKGRLLSRELLCLYMRISYPFSTTVWPACALVAFALLWACTLAACLASVNIRTDFPSLWAC